MNNDEINLYDIIQVLLKNKLLFSVVFLLCLIIGTIGAALKPNKYAFSQAIQMAPIGDINTDAQTDALITALEKNYIPNLLEQYYQAHKAKLDISSTATSKNTMVILSSTGKADQEKNYQHLFQTILNWINQTQKPLLLKQQQLLENKISTLRISISTKKKMIAMIYTLIKSDPKTTDDSSKYFKLYFSQTLNSSILDLIDKINDAQVQLALNSPSKFYLQELTITEVGVSKLLLIFLSALIGLILGLIVVLTKNSFFNLNPKLELE